MEKSKLTLIILGCIALSSCSQRPLPPRTTIVDTRVVEMGNGSNVTVLTQHAINGDIVEDTDNNLNIVSKTDNTKAVGLKVLQFTAMFLAGGNATVNTHSKEQLKGNHIASVKNKTMEYLNPEIDTLLSQTDIRASSGSKITIQPYKFKLIYNGLDDDDYEFVYSTTITAGDFHHVCSSNQLISTDRIQPFSHWENDNFNLTQTMTKKIINECILKLSSDENKEKLLNNLTRS